jgi:DNA repair protein RecN (Recombination protein N)
MLSLIRVKNYALIDEIEVEFGAGLNVMTGETGAGKSILVDALALTLGDRADAAAVRPGAERAEISATFEIPAGHWASQWLKERGLDDENTCNLRRLVGSDGRSRAFVNGQPVNLQDLRSVGALLVDIHGQHAHQSLLEAAHQRDLLDSHGNLTELADTVALAYSKWQALREQLEARRSTDHSRQAELELVQFQLAELDALAAADGEPASLRAERERLANTDRLLGGINAALAELAESDSRPAYSAVTHAHRELERLAEIDATLREPAAALGTVEIELREIENTLQRYRDRIEADPERLAWLEDRLARFRTLARRHGVAEGELAQAQAALRARSEALGGGTDSLEALEAKAQSAEAAYFAAAKKLSAKRTKHAAALAKAVTAEIRELGLPHGEFRIDLPPKPPDRADATGLERVEFEIKLNPGLPFAPLSKVASGGELSRISLGIEVVRTGASPVTAFVFDEVDAGIGGRVADIVGSKLRDLAINRQVLCVTHLPQVASHGEAHYRVVKLTDGKTSRTEVRRLSASDRLEELSRMLGGVEVTARTRAHAAEMIARAAR